MGLILFGRNGWPVEVTSLKEQKEVPRLVLGNEWQWMSYEWPFWCWSEALGWEVSMDMGLDASKSSAVY